MRRQAQKWIATTSGLAIAIGFVAHAFAAEPAGKGRLVAKRWCAACHVVNGGTSAVDAAPSFHQIANDPANTEARLRGVLSSPHGPMKGIALSRSQISAILGYLASLRAK